METNTETRSEVKKYAKHSQGHLGHICAKLFFSLSKSSREKTKFSSLIYFSDLLIIVHFVGEVSICAPYLICSAEPTWDYAVFAESPLFMSSKNTSNIWWMAPMKPCGLQISYNVIPFLVWFPSMTLCKEQSATFSKTQCQGSNNMKVGGKIHTDWNNVTLKMIQSSRQNVAEHMATERLFTIHCGDITYEQPDTFLLV